MSLQLLYRFKMILAGEPGSGKTSLFHRIIYSNSKGAEQANTSSNEEASFGSGYKNCTKEVKLSGNNKVNVTVFDTEGAERGKCMTYHYYDNADIVCLVYSLDRLTTLTGLDCWVDDAKNYIAPKALHSGEDLVYALVGVKADIPLDEREVKSADIERIAKRFEIPKDCCFEVSNASGDGIEHMVQHLAQKVYNLHTADHNSSIELSDYSSVSPNPKIPDNSTHETSRCKQWCCYCLCCFRLKRRNYETIIPS